MSSGSRYSSTGFTILYFEPLPKGGNWLGEVSVNLENWQHTISAFGGFDTASFEIIDRQDIIEDWVRYGLFRPIVVYDQFLTSIWEGFVDSITINQAGLSITIGPVTEISNRIFAIYSGVDTSVYPPQIGVRKKTPTFNNTTSQADWGIWWEILSMAGVTDSNADQLVALYMSEHGQPAINSNFSFSDSDISLSINCLGWHHTLKYPFNYTGASGTVSISSRIAQVLADDPNSWLSTDYSLIATNTTPIPLYEEDDQLAIEHVRGLTAMGDASNIRHIFGVYENRQAVYQPVSTQIDYTVDLAHPARSIYDISGAIVYPWRIRPGKWIFFSDFMSGLGSPFEDFHRDPRLLRIENVNFDMRTPYNVQFNGSTSNKYEQRQARLGLRGMEV